MSSPLSSKFSHITFCVGRNLLQTFASIRISRHFHVTITRNESKIQNLLFFCASKSKQQMRLFHSSGKLLANYYDVLGVSKNATQDEIKKAFIKKAKLHHPDVNKGDPNAQKNFVEVSTAYETLKDPNKRSMYDNSLLYGSRGPFQTQQGFSGWNPNRTGSYNTGAYNTGGGMSNDDFMKMYKEQFGDVFREFEELMKQSGGIWVEQTPYGARIRTKGGFKDPFRGVYEDMKGFSDFNEQQYFPRAFFLNKSTDPASGLPIMGLRDEWAGYIGSLQPDRMNPGNIFLVFRGSKLMSGTVNKKYSNTWNTVMDIRDKSGAMKGTVHVKKVIGGIFKSVQIFDSKGERLVRGFSLNLGIVQSAYLIEERSNILIARASITRWMSLLMKSTFYKVFVTNSRVEPQLVAFAFASCFS